MWPFFIVNRLFHFPLLLLSQIYEEFKVPSRLGTFVCDPLSATKTLFTQAEAV